MESPNQKIQFNVAEIQLSYKSNVKPSQRPKINCSKDAFNVFLANWDDTKLEFVDQFKVLLLSRANKVLGLFEVSSVGSTSTVADPKLIFAAAIKANAVGIILTHNHPSSNLVPGQADLELTQKIKNGGKILDIQLLDHLILSTQNYYSFADNGNI